MIPLAKESLESSVSSSGSDLLIQILFLCDLTIIMQGPLLKLYLLHHSKLALPPLYYHSMHADTSSIHQYVVVILGSSQL